MAEKKYKGAPFGSQTARFDVSGVHPKNKTPGTFTQTPYCKRSTDPLNTLLGPGRYDPEYGGFSEKALEEKAGGPGWARQYEVARMAALPHLLHKEQWQQKKNLRKKLGPGTYETRDFLDVADAKPRSIYGICDTKEERFKQKTRNEIPGPGTYGIGGVPHAALEEKNQKSMSTVGMLDAGSSNKRNLPAVGSHLGPGNYNFTSFTDEVINKVTSTRGPYDLFSGDRNKPMKTGHLAAPNHANLGPGQYEIKSCIDDWKSEHKMRHGRFGKMQQYPDRPSDRIYAFSLSQNPRKMEEPSPGSYDPKDISGSISHAKNSPPFLSSAQRSDRMATKFFTGNFNPVGAGRYDIQKFEDAQTVNGHSSVFKSKSGRPNASREKFLKERIRGKDVRGVDRVFMIRPENPHDHMMRTKAQVDASPLQAEFCSQRAMTVA